MREVPRRGAPASVAVLALVFFGGAALGLGLASLLVPSSRTASIISFLFLPTALVLGFHTWLGFAILLLLPYLVVRLVRGPHARRREGTDIVPPGAWTFLPVSSGLALAIGIVVALLADDAPAWRVMLIYWLAGSVYGAVLWKLARTGYLPFPDGG